MKKNETNNVDNFDDDFDVFDNNEDFEETSADDFVEGMISQSDSVIEIPTSDIIFNRRHCYSLYNDEKRKEMADSIRKYGLMCPIIVRKVVVDGKSVYEILAGHNRYTGVVDVFGENGTIKAFVKENLTDAEAYAIMVITNTHQQSIEQMPITKQAEIIGTHYKLMFSEEKVEEIEKLQKDIASGTYKYSARDDVGKVYSLSVSNVTRLLRIFYNLIDDVKPYADNELAVRTAVELSYLSQSEQQLLPPYIESFGTITWKQAEELKLVSQNLKSESKGDLTKQIIERILCGNIKEDEDKPKEKPISVKVTFNHDRFQKYFKDTPAEEVPEVIEKALELYFSDLGIADDETAF